MRSRALAPIAVSAAAAAFVGAVMFAAAPAWMRAMVRVVAAYDAGAVAMLAYYWAVILRSTPITTKARAAAEDPGRDAVLVIVLVAVVFGFLAAFDVLGLGHRQPEPHARAGVYALGLGAIVLGWLLIHTVFLFRYAHRYYWRQASRGTDDRPIIFPGREEPNDLDFAYFSFVLGMTFQVSDVQIADPGIRRFALAHALISFAYNTAILALVVNTVSNLLH